MTPLPLGVEEAMSVRSRVALHPTPPMAQRIPPTAPRRECFAVARERCGTRRARSALARHRGHMAGSCWASSRQVRCIRFPAGETIGRRAALMIGKESIAFNDRTGTAGDVLEKLLDRHFKLHAQRPKRGKGPAFAGPEQESLELATLGEKTRRGCDVPSGLPPARALLPPPVSRSNRTIAALKANLQARRSDATVRAGHRSL